MTQHVLLHLGRVDEVQMVAFVLRFVLFLFANLQPAIVQALHNHEYPTYTQNRYQIGNHVTVSNYLIRYRDKRFPKYQNRSYDACEPCTIM